jgi:hypothetical protein
MPTTKKLTNTNRNTDGKIILVDYDEFYWQNSLSLYLSMNIKRNIILVYTKGITVGKERIKKKVKMCNDMSFLHTKLLKKLTRQ